MNYGFRGLYICGGVEQAPLAPVFPINSVSSQGVVLNFAPKEHFAVSSEESPLGGTALGMGAGPVERSASRGHSQHPRMCTSYMSHQDWTALPTLSNIALD